MTWLGLIGGPLVMITGILVMFDTIERGGAVQTIATIPEFFWELSLSIYCIVKGFRLASPISEGQRQGSRPWPCDVRGGDRSQMWVADSQAPWIVRILRPLRARAPC